MKHISAYLFYISSINFFFCSCNPDIKSTGEEELSKTKIKIDRKKIDTLIENSNFLVLSYEDESITKEWLGLDSTRHSTGAVFIVNKLNPQQFASSAKCGVDTSHVTENIANAINLNGGLNKTTEFVDFDIAALIDYLKKSHEVGIRKIPDSVRAYFYRYTQSTAPHIKESNKPTVAFVPINGGTDLFNNAYCDTKPFNLGRLCPPDCEDIYPPSKRSLNDTGAILYRAGAQRSKYPLK